MIQLLPSIEDARIIREALFEFMTNHPQMSEEKQDATMSLIADVSLKIRRDTKSA